MDTQKLLYSDLSENERRRLESLADQIEACARINIEKVAHVVDQGNNPVNVRDWLFGLAWDIKCVARVGTPSYLV